MHCPCYTQPSQYKHHRTLLLMGLSAAVREEVECKKWRVDLDRGDGSARASAHGGEVNVSEWEVPFV